MRKFTVGLLAMLTASAFIPPAVNAAVVKMVTKPSTPKAPTKKNAPVAKQPAKVSPAKVSQKVADKGKAAVKETKKTIKDTRQKVVQAKNTGRDSSRTVSSAKGKNFKTEDKATIAKHAKAPTVTAAKQPVWTTSGKTVPVKTAIKPAPITVVHTAPKKATPVKASPVKTASVYPSSQPAYSTYRPYTPAKTQSNGSLPTFTASGGSSAPAVRTTTQSASIIPPISSFGKPKTPVNLDAPANITQPVKKTIYVGEPPNGPETRAKAVLVFDENDLKILYERNSTTRLPMASITKLMTAYVVVSTGQNMNEMLQISEEDIDHLKGTGSRLRIGTRLSRGEMLHLALMSSENRAASALGRYYPGGRPAFIKAMNVTAAMLGMTNTHYVDSNGLSPRNVSCARDLAKLVMAAAEYPLIRKYSTAEYHTIFDGEKSLNYGSTNRLTHNSSWKIQVQKTGYINEAGQCLVIKTIIDRRPVVMVLLNVVGPKGARIVDAQHIKSWLTHSDDSPRTSSASSTNKGRSSSFDESDFYN